MTDSNMLTLALSKGRIFEETMPMLRAAGIEVLEAPEASRKLIIPTNDPQLSTLERLSRPTRAAEQTYLI